MHLQGLDLNLLVVFDAIYTERSTTRAGKRLYLSQSATSGSLARLRDYFGDQLFVTSSQGLTPTPFAETLARPIQEILNNAQSVVAKSKTFDPATSTRAFVLNMSDVTAIMFVVKTLPRIRESAPNVQVEIVTYKDRIPEIVEEGDVDLSEIPVELASPNHPSHLLRDDDYVCIAWSGNRLLDREISIEQFLSLGHVTVRTARGEIQAERVIEAAGDRPRFQLIAPTFGTVPQALVNTNMIALMASHLAAYYSQIFPLKILPCPVKTKKLRFLLQWNRYRENDPGTQWMKNLLLSTIGECES